MVYFLLTALPIVSAVSSLMRPTAAVVEEVLYHKNKINICHQILIQILDMVKHYKSGMEYLCNEKFGYGLPKLSRGQSYKTFLT